MMLRPSSLAGRDADGAFFFGLTRTFVATVVYPFAGRSSLDNRSAAISTACKIWL
jgi:hypothetical protein